MELKPLLNIKLFGAKLDLFPLEPQCVVGPLKTIRVFVHDATDLIGGNFLLRKGVDPSIFEISQPGRQWVVREALQDAFVESLREPNVDLARRELIQTYLDLIINQKKGFLFSAEWGVMRV